MKFFSSITCLFLLAIWGHAGEPDRLTIPRENIEWCDLWISHANEHNLPRVLLIGDSITRAYYGAVEKQLEGKAYVARLASSHFVGDAMLQAEIAMVLDNMKFDVVQFNNGMHGWEYTEAEYRKNFPIFLNTIRKHAPKAKLIWATTTSLRDPTPASPDKQIPADNRIAERNAIALEFVRPLGIPVDDLHAISLGHPEYHSDNVHFNDQGIALQAAQISALIEKYLPR